MDAEPDCSQAVNSVDRLWVGRQKDLCPRRRLVKYEVGTKTLCDTATFSASESSVQSPRELIAWGQSITGGFGCQSSMLEGRLYWSESCSGFAPGTFEVADEVTW